MHHAINVQRENKTRAAILLSFGKHIVWNDLCGLGTPFLRVFEKICTYYVQYRKGEYRNVQQRMFNDRSRLSEHKPESYRYVSVGWASEYTYREIVNSKEQCRVSIRTGIVNFHTWLLICKCATHSQTMCTYEARMLAYTPTPKH